MGFAWISFGCRRGVIIFGLDGHTAAKKIREVVCEVVFSLSDFKTGREGFFGSLPSKKSEAVCFFLR